MKKRILAIGLGTVLTLAMLTGCGKNENLANTDFGTVTQEDIHQIAEEHHVDENIIAEIVEELTEEQKLEREIKNLVRDGVNAIYGPNAMGEVEPDWDWIDKHFSNISVGNTSKTTFATIKSFFREDYEKYKDSEGVWYKYGDTVIGTTVIFEEVDWDTFKFYEEEKYDRTPQGTYLERHNYLVETGNLDDEIIDAEDGREFRFSVRIKGTKFGEPKDYAGEISGEIKELGGEFYIMSIDVRKN